MKYLITTILLALAPLSWSEMLVPSKNWIVSNQDADTDCSYTNSLGQAALMVIVNTVYPPGARSKKVTGSVTLKYDVSSEGRTQNIRILETKLSPPYLPRSFERAAITAISRYRYKPTVRVEGEDIKVMNVRDVRCRIDFKP